MDTVVSVPRHADEVVQVPHAGVHVLTLSWCQRVDMMNQNAVVDLKAFDTEITAEVSRDSLCSGLAPNIGLIETLVHPPVPSERWFEELSSKGEIVEPLFESLESRHLVIAAHRNHLNIDGRRQEPQRRAPQSGLRTPELTP